jgi:spermidine synthase
LNKNLNPQKTNIDQNINSVYSFSKIFIFVLGCFFISGMTGLIYEILWTRMIVKIIGSAPFAVSIVLTIFMGGLGLGSFLAGKTIDRVKNPLTLIKIYGILEIIIGAYGFLLPLLLILFKPLYSFFYIHLFDYFLGYNILTFIGCSILLIIPVTCMGATLPVLSRFFVTNISQVGTHVGRLYGLNTIGAAVGSFLCGFWLINLLGIWNSLTFAISLNVLIGVLSILISHKLELKIGSSQTANETAVISGKKTPTETEASVFSRKELVYALLIFSISGFCAMAYEVTWVKLLGLIVGPTTYSFTIVLVTFISGLGLGSLFFGRMADKPGNTFFLLLSTQITAALTALILSQMMGNSQIFFSKLIHTFKDNFMLLSFFKTLVLFCFMFVPTFCFGATFPLVSKICTRSLSRTGRSIGYAYSINTIGAVLGSFCAGFIFIPFIGKENTITLLAVGQLLTAFLAGFHVFQKQTSKWCILAIPLIIGLILSCYYPHWNRKMLSKGKYQRFVKLEKASIGWWESLLSGTEKFKKYANYDVAYFGDGIGGFTTVTESLPNVLGETVYTLLNSGKADASSAKNDMFTQTLLAHFPMLFHKNPEKVLVLGLASGITSGEVLHYPVEELDAIEINRQVVKASDFFIPWNNNVLSDPRTNLIIQDGRAHLCLTDRKYDIIISEPSNPWMAGLATLFTKEFMGLARDRLNDNGIFVQWIHSYQMDWQTFSMVGRTFTNVFPEGVLVTTDPYGRPGPDFLLVGFKNKNPLNPEIARLNLQYAVKSKNMALHNHKLFYNYIMNEDLKTLFGKGLINTDERPYLEFRAPKLVHNYLSSQMISKKIIENKIVDKQTESIRRESSTNIDSQIDLAAYIMSFNKHDNINIDLANASLHQKIRYKNLMETYCANNLVHDFSFIQGDQLRKKCVSIYIERIKKVLNSSDDKISVSYYLGWTLLKNGMPKKGMKYFFNMLKIEPENDKAHDSLTQMFALADDPSFILRTLIKQIKQFPGNSGLHYQLGKIYQRYLNLEKAAQEYEKALSASPNFLRALNAYADVSAVLSRYDNAINTYRKMLTIKPGNPNIYYNLACLYSKQNKLEDSIHSLKKAVEKGYKNFENIKNDEDLDNIKNLSEYKKLVKDK